MKKYIRKKENHTQNKQKINMQINEAQKIKYTKKD